jgi:hypothetical protein
MKVGYRLFLFLFVFYAIVGGVYWYLGGEPLGITAVLIEDLVDCFQKIMMMGSFQMEQVSLDSIARTLGGHFQSDLLPQLLELA